MTVCNQQNPHNAPHKINRFHKDLVSFDWKTGIIIINLRKFNKVNLEYGTECGDETLINFMQNLRYFIEYGGIPEGSDKLPRLYKLDSDRFGLIVDFDKFEQFEAYCKKLSTLKVLVLRPDYIDENAKKLYKEEMERLAELGADTDDDDNNNGTGGTAGGAGSSSDPPPLTVVRSISPDGTASGWGNTNWADELEEDDNKAGGGDGGGSKKKSGGLKTRSLSRPNDGTDNMEFGCRVVGSYGVYCTYKLACQLEKEIKKNDKNGDLDNDELVLVQEVHKNENEDDHDHDNHNDKHIDDDL